MGPEYVWNRILRPFPSLDDGGILTRQQGELEVHAVTSERDYPMMLWSLLSYYRLSCRKDPPVVHDDGTLSERSRTRIRSYFPAVNIVRRAEADVVVQETFERYPLLLRLRRRLPHMLKLMDSVVFCRAPRFLLIDSDVLFFDEPNDLVDVRSLNHRFSVDVASVYAVDPEVLFARTGFRIADRVNCGLANIWREGVDFDRMEWLLASGAVDLDFCPPCIDQTLWAADCIRGGYTTLPPSYAVATGPGTDGLVAKHYVGLVLGSLRTARDYFFTEGIGKIRSLPVAKREGK
jgi:hypothetical protein